MESDGTSRGKTSEISTVSLSMDPARHATRSALALTLVCHSRCSSGRAVASNRKAVGASPGTAPASNRMSPPARMDPVRSLMAFTYEGGDSDCPTATPHGIFPAGIFSSTCIFSVSTTETSFDGPFAV